MFSLVGCHVIKLIIGDWTDDIARLFYDRVASNTKMLPRLLRTRALPGLVRGRWNGRVMQMQRRTLIAAPKPGDGPLMSRRADRELPGTSRPQLDKSKLLT